MNAVSLILVALLALPAPASAAIYKWTDETGRTHYSNRPPDAAKGARDLKVVVEDEPTPPAPAADPALLERIAMLERQVAAQQQAASQYAPPPQYYAPPTPPPPPDYYGYGYGYAPAYYYAPYYAPYVIYSGRFAHAVHRPMRPMHPIALPPVHRGGFRGGFSGGMRRR